MSLLARAKFKIMQKSPEILLAMGIGGAIVSTVLYIKQTPKAMQILEKSKRELFEVDSLIADEEKAKSVDYTEEDADRDRKMIKIQTAYNLVKTYALPAAIQAGSIFCILKSHSVLSKRHIATAAALAGLASEFKDYRKRVAERFDEQTEHELRYDIKQETVDHVVVGEDGKEQKVTETVDVININHGQYTYFFDASSRHWSPDPEINKMFLTGVINKYTRLLKKRGYVFLNEILKELDIPQTQAGQVVGWRFINGNKRGDNYISFGLENTSCEATRRFMNGLEAVALLEFNCDGYILDGCLDDVMSKI